MDKHEVRKTHCLQSSSEILGRTDLSNLQSDRNQIKRRSVLNILVLGHIFKHKKHVMVIVAKQEKKKIYSDRKKMIVSYEMQ